ncbi:MBL fold metallo-hydrolase [Xinfangfangia sp. D13-10-4-6]|uniref:MBL fold metallo-hydrolase n=1 Tax=Pseudogemmobacter hezensis TaxID=2737662 RepID=UPI00155409CB|nr:MBL fold metallo-hydrolase [Pseudogemmobacter hezensis]NPD17741.1 MBL fold metallo-hydrolase [Pseudogemmobacter hezensis]
MSHGEEKAQLLPELPLRCVLAGNAGPLTGPGTTTWILGQGEVTVIDPGPAHPAHLDAILAALSPGETVAAILVTHPHLDHSALAPALAAATGAPICGFGPAGSGRTAWQHALARAGLGGGEGLDHAFAPTIRLTDDQTLRYGAEELRVLHTPGHSAEHLCFAWRDVLFCGDQVMAWAPSLVSLPDGDMGAYMVSLQRLSAGKWRCLIPAHGALIPDARDRIAALIAHRRSREAKILAALASGPAQTDDLLAAVYVDTAPDLWPAARRNLLSHIDILIRSKAVSASAWPGESPVISLR